MSRKSQSQWDFGELFPPEQLRRVLTVSELTGNVRRLLEKDIGTVWVTGEVTNCRSQSSGHIYFTLKDGGSQLNAVLFRGESAANREFLQDGQKLILQGSLTVYEPRGQYQLIVRVIEPQGLGALQIAFEKLKRKLQAEGLFAAERKRPLPRYAQRLGIVTSPTGAALRDVLHVVQRRQPGLEIVLAPCRVQGEGAAAEIAEAIRRLNQWNQSAPHKLDLILVTRGGGSLEDLWAFNEEIVARALHESALPIVSAVGHEIDFTISDFVADLRAATPSVAAELITEGAFSSRQFVAEARRRLSQIARDHLLSARDDLLALRERLRRIHPRRQIEEEMQRLDELHTALFRRIRQSVREQRSCLENARRRLLAARPSSRLVQHREALLRSQRRLRDLVRHRIESAAASTGALATRLRLLSPENVLARGYSITTDTRSGKVLRASSDTRAGQRISTRLHHGVIQSVVNPEPPPG